MATPKRGALMPKHDNETFILSRNSSTPASAAPFFLVMNGVHKGQKVPIPPGCWTIGREGADIILGQTDPAMSRRHAEVERRGDEVAIRDCQSKNGVFVDDKLIVTARLGHGQTVLLGQTLLKFVIEMSSEIGELTSLVRRASNDGLTGVCNKLTFLERLVAEFARAQRHGERLGVLMIDLDRFKHLNDRYGHLAGDQMLIVVARTIEGALRKEDLLARFGGEEFVVLMPDIDQAGASAAAERVRAAVEMAMVEHQGRQLRVTVSIGSATYHRDDSENMMPEQLLAAADARLYEAKQAGRNCCR